MDRRGLGFFFCRAAAAMIFMGLAAPAAGGSPDSGKKRGTFTVLTYNVAGLPQGISQSQPLFFMAKISPRLNDFELVLAQEDFFYGDRLRSRSRHPYYSGRSRDGILGDGLSRFSVLPFDAVDHVAWQQCHGTWGHANDCLTPKGFSKAGHLLAPGVEIDVYNLHMDAGGGDGDVNARDQEMDQLIAYMEKESKGKAVIIGGDWNLSGKRERDLAVLQRIMDKQNLADSCRVLECGAEKIDRILFRNGASVKIEPVAYKVEHERFSTGIGWPLSDHKPVSVRFEWEYLGE